DLRDVPRSVIDGAGAGEGGEPEEGGCMAVYIPGVEAPVLGQTWDMHGTAEPYVRLLHLRPRGGDEEYLCFTLAGCLGMTGLSARGVGVTINNLTSTDAQIGVVWPALVRALLREPSAAAARDRLMATPLSSGHHYMIADGHDFYGVETSGRLKVVTQQGGRAAHLHTNHCFDPVLRKVEKVARTSTTFRRMEIASTLYVQQRPRDADELWDFLSSHEGYPRSICSHVDDAGGDPSASRTCGRMVLDLGRGRVLASPGCGQANPSRTYTLDRWRPPAPQASV
ncbi:MAG TPA: C45 family autoproteolytic acyltransferase/hydrolase, partial [Nannocystaceae bacterium]|nr:C45 family autoproteolytic acyltransferase/hydrolase [Nannocystaceae bacterium]